MCVYVWKKGSVCAGTKVLHNERESLRGDLSISQRARARDTLPEIYNKLDFYNFFSFSLSLFVLSFVQKLIYLSGTQAPRTCALFQFYLSRARKYGPFCPTSERANSWNFCNLKWKGVVNLLVLFFSSLSLLPSRAHPLKCSRCDERSPHFQRAFLSKIYL